MDIFKEKKFRKIFDKIGFDKNDIFRDVLLRLIDGNEKYGVWLANVLYNDLYNVEFWSEEYLKTQVDKIISWKKENPDLHLNDFKSFSKAAEAARIYFKRKISKNKKESSLYSDKKLMDFGEYKWVELTTLQSILEEGVKMRNCLKEEANAYEYTSNFEFPIYSLRDKNNVPKATLAINGEGIVCLEGVCGGYFDPSLIHYVEKLFYKLKIKYFYSIDHSEYRFLNSLAGNSLKDIVAFLKRYKTKTTKKIFNEFIYNFFAENADLSFFNSYTVYSKILKELKLTDKEIIKIVKALKIDALCEEMFFSFDVERVRFHIQNFKSKFRFLKKGQKLNFENLIEESKEIEKTIKELIPIDVFDCEFMELPNGLEFSKFPKVKKINFFKSTVGLYYVFGLNLIGSSVEEINCLEARGDTQIELILDKDFKLKRVSENIKCFKISFQNKKKDISREKLLALKKLFPKAKFHYVYE